MQKVVRELAPGAAAGRTQLMRPPRPTTRRYQVSAEWMCERVVSETL